MPLCVVRLIDCHILFQKLPSCLYSLLHPCGSCSALKNVHVSLGLFAQSRIVSLHFFIVTIPCSHSVCLVPHPRFHAVVSPCVLFTISVVFHVTRDSLHISSFFQFAKHDLLSLHAAPFPTPRIHYYLILPLHNNTLSLQVSSVLLCSLLLHLFLSHPLFSLPQPTFIHAGGMFGSGKTATGYDLQEVLREDEALRTQLKHTPADIESKSIVMHCSEASS